MGKCSFLFQVVNHSILFSVVDMTSYNVQIVYCIVNYGVVLLPGVASLMSTAREICIKGKRIGDRSQSSEHLRPVKNRILRRINRLQLRVKILYCYVEFCINLHFFLFDNILVIIEYCLI
jgi:hypothetical protein